MKIDFMGKVVFLTGASRGIGKKIKEMMEEQGARVIAPGHDVLDLSSRKSIEGYLADHDKDFCDIFIHCAGINMLAGIDEITQDVLDQVFQVNCFAPALLLRYFSQHMRKKKWGRIIFVSSLYAVISKERRIAYSSSKNALTGLAKTLALELAPYNILVNTVAPGYVMTEMTKKNLSSKEIEEIKGNIPMGRLQTEEDIANAIAFLCSEYNQSITGQQLVVDGGLTCR